MWIYLTGGDRGKIRHLIKDADTRSLWPRSFCVFHGTVSVPVRRLFPPCGGISRDSKNRKEIPSLLCWSALETLLLRGRARPSNLDHLICVTFLHHNPSKKIGKLYSISYPLALTAAGKGGGQRESWGVSAASGMKSQPQLRMSDGGWRKPAEVALSVTHPFCSFNTQEPSLSTPTSRGLHHNVFPMKWVEQNVLTSERVRV